jgi:8-oxo-dGTP diphosphatase
MAPDQQGEAPGVAQGLKAYPAGARRGDAALVRAGGGVVWQLGDDGQLQVVLVHRPKYDDWSLPKGKCEVDEAEADAAIREVEEETGLRCHGGPELTSSAYVDRKGRPKVVRWWVMTVIGGELQGANEVDDARWCSIEVARELLSYGRDIEVLDAFLSRPSTVRRAS